MIASPICQRCGGVNRSLSRRERKAMGFMGLLAACCCDSGQCPGTSCSDCPGETPDSYDIAIDTQPTPCPGCNDCTGTGSDFSWQWATTSGCGIPDFCVNQSSGCSYLMDSGSFSGTCEADVYDDTTCTNQQFGGWDTVEANVRAVDDGGQLTLAVWIGANVRTCGGINGGSSALVSYFYGEAAISSCLDTVTMSNNLLSCNSITTALFSPDGTDNDLLGTMTGGQITVTACCA